MNRAQFEQYISSYNAGDLDAVLAYYSPDVVFENFGSCHKGAEVAEFLQTLHAAVETNFTVRKVLIDGSQIAMEADCEIKAKMDLPDLPAGAMKKGQRCIVRTFAFYETESEKIINVKVAGWPPMAIS